MFGLYCGHLRSTSRRLTLSVFAPPITIKFKGYHVSRTATLIHGGSLQPMIGNDYLIGGRPLLFMGLSSKISNTYANHTTQTVGLSMRLFHTNGRRQLMQQQQYMTKSQQMRKRSVVNPGSSKVTRTINGRVITSSNWSSTRKPLLAFPLLARAFGSSAKKKAKDGVGKSTELKKDTGFWRLLAFAKPEYGRLGIAVGLLLISSAVTMSVPFGLGKLIDLIFNAPDAKQQLATISKYLLGIFVVGGVANFGRIYMIQTSGQRIIARLRNGLFGSMMKQEAAYYDKNRTGELINRLSSDTVVVGKAFSDNISDGMRSIAQAMGSFGMMLYMSPKLTAVVFMIVPPVVGLSMLYGRFVKQISANVQSALADANTVAEERISNIRTVRAFSGEKMEEKEYARTVDKAYELSKSEAVAKGIFYGSAGFTGNVIMLSVLWYGGTMMMDGEITVGNLTSFLLYAAYVGISTVGLSSFYGELMKGVGASTRLWEIMDREPHISHSGGQVIPADQFKGRVEFQDVGFHYPTRSDKAVFDGLNLDIEPGHITAIVGSSGSGKSTLAWLILRLYDVPKGRIAIDGRDIKDLDVLWLRGQISIVNQEPVLFSSSIHDNIAYSKPDASQDEVIQAAKQANALDFIHSFPQGFDTKAGERGAQISGGQKQRIAIARAILRNPKLLILDEATSALDSESEHLVQQALENVMHHRTTIVIAHRLSTIKNADKIVLLNEGKVADMGTYDELIKRSKFFKALIDRQRFQGSAAGQDAAAIVASQDAEIILDTAVSDNSVDQEVRDNERTTKGGPSS